ncbi:triose-phosphate isomerase [Desertibaculum subflavum]|uniref:triose-phosphate isomerase n=1 Tax=Desertibaculum subflavum TaxID=2268458 RepID=UPI000E674A9F
MTTRRPLIAGNWKMNGLQESGAVELALLQQRVTATRPAAEVVICPPATLAANFAVQVRGSGIGIGGQDCHVKASGAHTGDISAEMLADAGASHVIVGHSERRADHGETDGLVRTKAEAAHRAGLTAIICVGETLEQRDAGRTIEIVSGQVAGSVPEAATPANTVIAYEPVWAIGTGRTPTEDDIAAVHAAIRRRLADWLSQGADFRILYGGSVKPSNAKEILALKDVDGALVGGASLKAADFWPIVEAAG